MNKPIKHYVIDWYMGGNLIETINLNRPTNKFITKSKIKELSKTTHNIGKLIAREVKL